MSRRVPLRIQKAYDTYRLETGNAGFVKLIKNGARIMPKNITLTFTRRKHE